MPTRKSPRKGSLQYWPRKRVNKFLPRVNWNAISKENSEAKGILGVIGYKAGMLSAYVKDNTKDSMTNGQEIKVPATVIECPPMKILSVRIYNNKKVSKDILNDKLDKELKKKIKLPKSKKELSKELDSIDTEKTNEITLIVYSQVKKTNLKSKPDIIEVGISGNLQEKIDFIKEKAGKEILASEIFNDGEALDVRGLTKGKGFQGPVKRFGIALKASKSEKGRRRPGSLAPWHPARVTFRSILAGQLGMFTRAHYNYNILEVGNPEKRKITNIKNYGNIKTEYVVVRGSLQGPSKRQIIITKPLRLTKKQLKKSFELQKLR